MLSLFLGLTIANLAGLLTAAVLGYAAAGRPDLRGLHILAGALGAMLCIGVHCVVFTYFVATAKWVRHAIELKGLDPDLATPTRSFKVMAFPAALGSMCIVFIAACLGAARDVYGISPAWHHLLALAGVAVNLAAAVVEYQAIARNGRLIDRVLAHAGAREPGND